MCFLWGLVFVGKEIRTRAHFSILLSGISPVIGLDFYTATAIGLSSF